MFGDKDVSVERVLEVMAEFEKLEPAGVSSSLVAWELVVSEDAVAAAMRRAAEDGMIERVGWDHQQREQLFRITARGRDRIHGGGVT